MDRPGRPFTEFRSLLEAREAVIDPVPDVPPDALLAADDTVAADTEDREPLRRGASLTSVAAKLESGALLGLPWGACVLGPASLGAGCVRGFRDAGRLRLVFQCLECCVGKNGASASGKAVRRCNGRAYAGVPSDSIRCARGRGLGSKLRLGFFATEPVDNLRLRC